MCVVSSIGISSLPRQSGAKRNRMAPEIEFAIADGIALEFELPFEEGTLESYKFASQFTFIVDETTVHGERLS